MVEASNLIAGIYFIRFLNNVYDVRSQRKHILASGLMFCYTFRVVRLLYYTVALHFNGKSRSLSFDTETGKHISRFKQTIS